MDEKMLIVYARGLRLAVIRQQYIAGNLTEQEAAEILSGPLSPGGPPVEDSGMLKTSIGETMEWFDTELREAVNG